MLGKQDWIQFVLNVIARVIAGLLLLSIPAAIAYVRSERFRRWAQRLANRLWRWLHAGGQLVVGVIVVLAIAAATYALTQALGLGLTQSLLSVVLVLFLTLANFLLAVWHRYPSERRGLVPESQEIRAATAALRRELEHFNHSEQTDVETSAERDIIHAWTDLRAKCHSWELVVGRRLTPEERAEARRVCRTMEQARDTRHFWSLVPGLSGDIISLSHIALDRVE